MSTNDAATPPAATPASANGVKVAKKGDFIVKEGDKINSIILLQSGSASLCLARPKKNVDLFPLSSSQVIGEQAFLGAQNHTLSVVATSEVKYMEIPVVAARAQVDASPQFLKLVVKSLTDRLKNALNEIKGLRLDKDSLPCPDDQVAKVFGSIYHAANHKATSEDEKNASVRTMDWVQFKQYCQRIFGESPRRIEQACNILVKLKLANYGMGKPIDDPEGADEIQKIHFFDLSLIESFFEFFQYYYFKGSSGLIIKYDESSYNLLGNFLKLAETLPLDRHGAVYVPYTKVIEDFKSHFSITLNTGHFSQLENRGLFAKRQAKSDGNVQLSFDLKEWKVRQTIWKMLREIDKWNEKGTVSLVEEETLAKKKPEGPTCPQCGVGVLANAKFCQECGSKIETTAKAA